MPRLQFVALMQASNTVVLSPSRQYVRQSWQNRTRIRTPDGVQWLSIPIRSGQHPRSSAATVTADNPNWRRHHWKAIRNSYGHAPYFDHYADVIRIFLQRPWKKVGDVATASVALLHKLYNLDCTITIGQSLPQPDAVHGSYRLLVTPDDRPKEDPSYILHFEERPYRQAFTGFAPELTALDLLFGYGPAAPSMVRAMATINKHPQCKK